MNIERRIALVEDDARYRELLVELCSACRVTVGGVFDCAEDALRGLLSRHCDIALIDLGLPDAEGSELIAQLRTLAPRTQCLVLTKFDDDEHLFRALQSGAAGYLLKDMLDSQRLRSAIDDTFNGGAPMSPSIARRVLASFQVQRPSADVSTLTDRELQILDLLAAGHGAKDVSRLLGIAYETVRCHQKSIYRKLQVNSVVQAVARANAMTASHSSTPWSARRPARTR